MRLKKGQKERLLEWIAEGLRSDEINERASQDEPFSVSRGQVDYYRRTRKLVIEAIKESGEHEALTTGLAKKSERVKKLKQLAALLEEDLFGDLLWLDQVKGVGSGTAAMIVDYVEFNRGEIEAYRGVLDDIASEVGHRVKRQQITGKDGGPLQAVVATDEISNLTAGEVDARLGSLFAFATAETTAEAEDAAEGSGGAGEH